MPRKTFEKPEVPTDPEARRLYYKKLKTHRVANEKFRYYEPSGVGEDFINAFSSGDYFILFLSSANGFGKTALACNIIANLMYPGNNPWFKGKLFEDWEFLKKGRIITESDLVDKNIVSELKKWFPKDRYTTSKGGKHYESRFKSDTGWDFDIMTYDQDPKQFEGVTLGFAWLDEPPPDHIIKATISRMRKGGIIVITATPISGSAHLYDMFAKGEVETQIQLREGDEPVTVKRRVFHLTADVESVCKQHGVRGHLEHDHIVQMISEYPEEERQARIFGKFQHLVGLVYKQWDRTIHVIKPFALDPNEYTVYHALDPHPRNPDAGLWVAVDRKGRKYVVDEYYENPTSVKELAYDLKKKNSLYNIAEPHLIDPSAMTVDQHTNNSVGRMLRDEGLLYIEGSKARQTANARIGTALDYRKLNGDIVKPPELYVFENCKRFIYEIEHLRWQEWRGRTGMERNRKDVPVDKDDHTLECLGRILVNEPTFREPVIRHHRHSVIKEADFDPYR